MKCRPGIANDIGPPVGRPSHSTARDKAVIHHSALRASRQGSWIVVIVRPAFFAGWLCDRNAKYRLAPGHMCQRQAALRALTAKAAEYPQPQAKGVMPNRNAPSAESEE